MRRLLEDKASCKAFAGMQALTQTARSEFKEVNKKKISNKPKIRLDK